MISSIEFRSAARVMTSCAANRIVAPRIRNGTAAANQSVGVLTSKYAPTIPPTSDGTASISERRLTALNSRRKPIRLASEPGHSATVFVALATTGVIPVHISAGKGNSVTLHETE